MSMNLVCECGHARIDHDPPTWGRCCRGTMPDGSSVIVDPAYNEPNDAVPCPCRNFIPAGGTR